MAGILSVHNCSVSELPELLILSKKAEPCGLEDLTSY